MHPLKLSTSISLKCTFHGEVWRLKQSYVLVHTLVRRCAECGRKHAASSCWLPKALNVDRPPFRNFSLRAHMHMHLIHGQGRYYRATPELEWCVNALVPLLQVCGMNRRNINPRTTCNGQQQQHAQSIAARPKSRIGQHINSSIFRILQASDDRISMRFVFDRKWTPFASCDVMRTCCPATSCANAGGL